MNDSSRDLEELEGEEEREEGERREVGGRGSLRRKIGT